MSNEKDVLVPGTEAYKELTDSNSVIGIKNGFSGEFHSNGLLRIDGDFKGEVKGRGVVLVGENGRIVGNLYAKSVRIGGKIKGNVYAINKVEILSTGKLYGDLYTSRVSAEEGMIFTGNGKTLSKEEMEEIFKKQVDSSPAIIEEDF